MMPQKHLECSAVHKMINSDNWTNCICEIFEYFCSNSLDYHLTFATINYGATALLSTLDVLYSVARSIRNGRLRTYRSKLQHIKNAFSVRFDNNLYIVVVYMFQFAQRDVKTNHKTG